MHKSGFDPAFDAEGLFDDDWLLQAGFASVAGYGEDGQPLTQQHRRLIVVADRG